MRMMTAPSWMKGMKVNFLALCWSYTLFNKHAAMKMNAGRQRF
jgi:hypothetical protein